MLSLASSRDAPSARALALLSCCLQSGHSPASLPLHLCPGRSWPLFPALLALREGADTWDDLPDSDDEGAEAIIARRDAAEDSHLDALLELRDAFFPQANLCCEGHMGWRRRRCPCGMWRPPWPWMVHSPRGYDCQCWKAAERLAWETMHALHDPHHGLRGRAACV